METPVRADFDETATVPDVQPRRVQSMKRGARRHQQLGPTPAQLVIGVKTVSEHPFTCRYAQHASRHPKRTRQKGQSMIDDNATSGESAPRYETKTVTAVRGFEARTRSKWESAGWEFVNQDEGRIRSALHFRRPKKITPRWVWIAGGSVAALAVVAIVLGSIFGDDDTTKADATTATATAAPISVPDVSGLAGDEAKKNITDAGLEVKWDAGEASVWVASNWIVLTQSPKAGTRVADNSTVTLKVERKANETATSTATGLPAQSKSAAPAAPAQAADTTPSGLDSGWASTACQQYGEQQFPYGFKAHTLIGLLAQEVQGDEIYLKFEADITNGFGAKRKATVECLVGGTNGSPNVTSFIAY